MNKYLEIGGGILLLCVEVKFAIGVRNPVFQALSSCAPYSPRYIILWHFIFVFLSNLFISNVFL